jgi:pimeloyl-ACP methyl ester carboxylesterase
MSELLMPGPGGHPIPGDRRGAGPAVLLLHAGSADRSSWAGVAAALAGRFRVLRFDRWIYRDGHGDAAPAGAEAMAAEVGDVLAVAAAAGERPLLVGHSSGAVVALESALTAPSASWPPCFPGWRRWSSWRGRATWPTWVPPRRSPG